MLGFQTTPGQGGREKLEPASAWFEVVKWQALSAREVAEELGIDSIWSWGWAVRPGPEQDPDKLGAACVWLWTRAPALCNGPAAAGAGFDKSLTEGQLLLAPGTQCRVGTARITEGAVRQLASLTGDRELAFTALLARIVEARDTHLTSRQIVEAERRVIVSRFGGNVAQYRAALAQSGATVAIARGILGDELRRARIAKTISVRRPSASEVAKFYESYPDLLVRKVTASPAPAWLGWQKRGLALDSIAPDSVFKLRSGSTGNVLTVDGAFRVRPVGEARPLGTMPLSAVTPTIRAALTLFARGAAFDDRMVAQQSVALASTVCANDGLPSTGAVELESFLPFLAATA